jgi:hypothetical protein
MDTAETALYSVATMEEAEDQSQETYSTGDRKGKSLYIGL